MRPIYADGTGRWPLTDGAAGAPPCAGLAPNALRGVSQVTRIAIDVALQATREAGADPRAAATVFGSGLGEIQTAVQMLDLIETTGSSSPIRFKNSVHNAASGNFGVALANRGFSTALSAGDELAAVALLEAWAYLSEHDGDVVVALAEESIPAPLPGHGGYAPLGVGLHLRARPPHGRPAVMLSNPRRVTGASARPAPAAYAGNVVAWALPLLEAIRARREGDVALGPDAVTAWCVTVTAL